MGMGEFDAGADVLASGIHDAKNRLFEAQTLLVEGERAHGASLPDVHLAIDGVASRLSKTLVAYRLMRGLQPLAILPVSLGDLVEDAQVAVHTQFERAGIALRVKDDFGGVWPLDRTLAADVLVNALQNACRFARTAVELEVRQDGGHLRIGVNDDGPGYAGNAPGRPVEGCAGLGLFIARQIAALHVRKGARGRLELSDGGALGGALFELTLP